MTDPTEQNTSALLRERAVRETIHIDGARDARQEGATMATKTKKRKRAEYTFAKEDAPNQMSHREATRKQKRCQLCGTKVPLTDQYTVQNDLENLTVTKRKNAARKGAETMSHYCSDCADKRVTQKQAWIDSVYSGGNGKAKSKPAARKAAKAVAKPKAKPKAAKPKATAKPKAKSVRKPKAKAVATSEKEPF